MGSLTVHSKILKNWKRSHCTGWTVFHTFQCHETERPDQAPREILDGLQQGQWQPPQTRSGFFFLGGEIPLNSLPRRKLRIRGGKSDYKGAVLDVTLSSLAVLFSVDSGRRKRKTHSLFNSCSLRSWLGQWRDWRQLVWGRGKLAKGKVMEWRSLPPDQIYSMFRWLFTLFCYDARVVFDLSKIAFYSFK